MNPVDRKPHIGDAVRELVGGSTGGTVGDFESITYNDGQTPPTKAEAETKLIELVSAWDAQEYARNRQAEYPTIAELTVALYDTDDKSAVEAKRAAVKLKYPKP